MIRFGLIFDSASQPPPSFKRAGTKIFDHDIGTLDQIANDLLTLCRFQVQRQRFLVTTISCYDFGNTSTTRCRYAVCATCAADRHLRALRS